MNNSFSCIRKRQILDCLDKCDCPASREDLLLDKIIKLENTLHDLQEAYVEISLSYKRLSCVQVPF